MNYKKTQTRKWNSEHNGWGKQEVQQRNGSHPKEKKSKTANRNPSTKKYNDWMKNFSRELQKKIQHFRRKKSMYTSYLFN